jgi:RNA polymerase sigma-70 factor (ECF subfamily)
MNDKEEKQLIAEFLAGDESAFNLLARKYRKRIYWHARRMVGNHSDADEIAQEVLLAMFEKLDSFKGESSLSTWIYKITSSRSLNLIKKRKIKDFVSLDFLAHKRNSEDIVKNYEEKEKLNGIEKLLTSLPVKQREVFVLRHFEELSYKEIAEITGQSVGALKANYFHALKKVLGKVKND